MECLQICILLVFICKFLAEKVNGDIWFILLHSNSWGRFFIYVPWHVTITALADAKAMWSSYSGSTCLSPKHCCDTQWYTVWYKNNSPGENCQSLGENAFFFLFLYLCAFTLEIKRNLHDFFLHVLLHALLMSWEYLCSLTWVTNLSSLHGKDQLYTSQTVQSRYSAVYSSFYWIFPAWSCLLSCIRSGKCVLKWNKLWKKNICSLWRQIPWPHFLCWEIFIWMLIKLWFHLFLLFAFLSRIFIFTFFNLIMFRYLDLDFGIGVCSVLGLTKYYTKL